MYLVIGAFVIATVMLFNHTTGWKHANDPHWFDKVKDQYKLQPLFVSWVLFGVLAVSIVLWPIVITGIVVSSIKNILRRKRGKSQ